MKLLTVGKKVLKTLNEAGYEAYFVGGMVRDQLLGRSIYDVDITTSATPNVVMSLFEKTIATGLAHGTVTVMMDQFPVEVTTFRVETGYSDYRHPNEIHFTSSLAEDLKRRDFTINAIAQDSEGYLHDPMNGLVDLKSRCLKCVGDSTKRFTEDPLRILRGIRFVSKLGFNLDQETLEGMKQVNSLIENISKERVKKELEGIIQGDFRQDAMSYLYDIGLLNYLPGLSTLASYQGYNFNLLTHPILLFTLASLSLEELNSYLMSWPFSREERKCISVLSQAIANKTPMPYFLYQYKEEWAQLYHELICFLNQKQIHYKTYMLPIQSRKDLAVNVKTITTLIDRPKGPWIQQLVEMIEYEIVMNQLVNEKSAIIEFIKAYEQGVKDEKKE